MLSLNNAFKSSLCVLGLLIASKFVNAQPPSVSALLTRLKHAKEDTSRIHIYKALVTAYRNQNPDSAIFYAEQGVSFFRKVSYPIGVGLMEGQMGYIYMGMGKMDLAKKHITSALLIFKKANYTPGLVTANNALGVCFAKIGAFKDAAHHFFAALKINQHNNDLHGLVQSYIKLGALNEQINDLNKSLDYYERAFDLNKQLKERDAEASLLNNIGIIYARKGAMKKALGYFLSSISMCQPEQLELKAVASGNAGDAFQQLGDLQKAFNYQNQALQIARKLRAPEPEARTLVNLASLKIKTKPDTSLLLLGQALKITKNIKQHYVRLDVYTGLIDVYKHLGKYKEATGALEAREDLKDSLFTLKNSKEIANLQATNDLANEKINVQRLQLSTARSKFTYWITLAVAISTTFFLVIVALFYRKTRGLNKQLLIQQKELRKLNDFKDKLFSIISHDLRSPVATIVNLLGILEEDEDTLTVKAFIPRLKQHSESTLDVMDKLLIWGHAQLKGDTQSKVPFNVKEIIQESLHLHKEIAEQKKIALIDNSPNEVMVFADRSHIEFVIRNLVANAIKYTHPNGFVEISANSNQPAGFTTLIIKDNGIGVEKSLQKKIFEPDNQSMKGTDNEKGNSIGLMLCKEFVERNGGKIWVESDLGKGTSFFVSLLQHE